MKRETIKAFLEDATLEDKDKIDKILNEYHTKLNEIKSTLKTDEQVKEAIAEAIKAVETKKDEDKVGFNELKKLKEEFESYKFKSELEKALKDAGVKEKFQDVVISKIAKDKDTKEQLTKLKEEYAECFEIEDKKDPLPSFGTPTKGAPGTSEQKEKKITNFI